MFDPTIPEWVGSFPTLLARIPRASRQVVHYDRFYWNKTWLERAVRALVRESFGGNMIISVLYGPKTTYINSGQPGYDLAVTWGRQSMVPKVFYAGPISAFNLIRKLPFEIVKYIQELVLWEYDLLGNPYMIV